MERRVQRTTRCQNTVDSGAEHHGSYSPYVFHLTPAVFSFAAFTPPRNVPGTFVEYALAPLQCDAQMCKWNLQKFAEALAPALPLADSTAALEKYDGLFKGYYEEGMRRFGSEAE